MPAETLPTSPRRRLNAEERRATIIASARHVFAQRGFHGTSTAEIAEAAGCSEPTLYKHFDSKLAIFVAVLDDAMRQLEERCVLGVEASLDADPVARIAGVSPLLIGEPWFYEVVRLRSLAFGLLDEAEVRAIAVRSVERFRGMVARLVREGQERGTVRADADPEAISWIWFGTTLVSSYRQVVEGDAGCRRMPELIATLHRLIAADPAQ